MPVAGVGTRLLPATKAQPKEMLPVVDKPVIQYIVEEAVAAGIEEIIFVTSVGKRAIEDHFDRNFELEYRLNQKKKHKELDEIKKIGRLAKFAFVRQAKPLGDGNAILSAMPFIDAHEPVAIFFGDDILHCPKVPGIGQMMKTFERYGDPVIAVGRVPKETVKRWGVIDGIKVSPRVYEIKELVEKPDPREAPSNLAIIGRYIVTPDVLELLKKQKPGKDGEIRLADALETALTRGKPLYGQEIDGTWYGTGTKLDYLTTSIALGLEHPELNGKLKDFLKGLKM